MNYIFDKDNNIADFNLEYSDYNHYSIYPNGKDIYINCHRLKITKYAILFDIENIVYRKEANILKDFKMSGISRDLVDRLNKEYDISLNELKEAIDSGKNRYSKRYTTYKPTTRFTVSYWEKTNDNKPRLWKEN